MLASNYHQVQMRKTCTRPPSITLLSTLYLLCLALFLLPHRVFSARESDAYCAPCVRQHIKDTPPRNSTALGRFLSLPLLFSLHLTWSNMQRTFPTQTPSSILQCVVHWEGFWPLKICRKRYTDKNMDSAVGLSCSLPLSLASGYLFAPWCSSCLFGLGA